MQFASYFFIFIKKYKKWKAFWVCMWSKSKSVELPKQSSNVGQVAVITHNILPHSITSC